MATSISGIVQFQRLWRGYVERKKRPDHCFLSPYLLERAERLVAEKSSSVRAIRSRSIYAPKGLPIILKLCDHPTSVERFSGMKEARELCQSKAYEHLTVPEGRVCGEFLVEQRLPIGQRIDFKEQIGLYIEHREQFTRAVQEFTALCFQSTCDDLEGDTNHPFGELSDAPIGRYDNVVLYLDQGKGKLGLVDLEGFTIRNNSFQFPTAIYLFPYHFETIMSVAKTFDPSVEKDRKDLEKMRDGSLRRFKILYEDHSAFIEGKGITLEDPTAFPEFTPERIEQLRVVLGKNLQLLSADRLGRIGFQKCLGDHPDQTLTRFNKEAFPEVIGTFHSLIRSFLKNRLQCMGGTITSKEKLLSVRTISFSSLVAVLQNNKVKLPPFEMMNIEEVEHVEFCAFLFETLLEELKRGGEIAYYNPSLGCGNHAKQFIFC